nr:tail fiber domain-containing protein [Dendrosporobacter quercicolus]
MYIGNNLDLPINFRRNNIDRCFIDSGAFAPSVDNNFALGGSGLRWSQIFAASATINTSDERSKTDIKDLDLGLDFVNSLRPVEFKYKVRQNELSQVEDGTETVEVEPERTETRVVTPAKYETVIIEPAKYETVVIQSEELDEEGNVITEAVTEERLVKEAVTEEKLVSEEITEEVIIPAVTKEQPKYKEVITPLPGKRPHAGLIAQEVEEVLGERDIGLFTIGEDGSHGLRYTEFIGPLIKAVQELSAKVDQQAAEIAELKNQTA